MGPILKGPAPVAPCFQGARFCDMSGLLVVGDVVLISIPLEVPGGYPAVLEYREVKGVGPPPGVREVERLEGFRDDATLIGYTERIHPGLFPYGVGEYQWAHTHRVMLLHKSYGDRCPVLPEEGQQGFTGAPLAGVGELFPRGPEYAGQGEGYPCFAHLSSEGRVLDAEVRVHVLDSWLHFSYPPILSVF